MTIHISPLSIHCRPSFPTVHHHRRAKLIDEQRDEPRQEVETEALDTVLTLPAQVWPSLGIFPTLPCHGMSGPFA